MYKFVLLIVLFVIAGAFIGCEQQELSEEEIRSVVREEVAFQLTGRLVEDVVAQEVTSQLANIDDIVTQEITGQLSTVDDTIQKEVTKQLDSVADMLRQEVTDKLSSIDTLTVSELYIKHKDGGSTITLGANAEGEASLMVINDNGEIVAYLGTTSDDSGELSLCDSGGNIIASLLDMEGNGQLWLHTSSGEIGSHMGTAEDGYPSISLSNEQGEMVIFMCSFTWGEGFLCIYDQYGEYSFTTP